MDLGRGLPGLASGLEVEPGGFRVAGAAGGQSLALGCSELEIEHLLEGSDNLVLKDEASADFGCQQTGANLSKSNRIDELERNANAVTRTNEGARNYQIDSEYAVCILCASNLLSTNLRGWNHRKLRSETSQLAELGSDGFE